MKPSEGATVEVSYAEAPVDSVPVQASFVPASKTTVEIDEVPFATLNGSQSPVDVA